MARLTPEQRQARLKFDYLVIKQMSPTAIMQVSAYRNTTDLRARRNAITSDAEGHLATHYLIDYKIRTLVGEGRYGDTTTVWIDVLANGNYPFSEPACWVISNEMPWSPHFKFGEVICIGEVWKDARGSILLGQLIIHIAKLLNFDEVARGGGYVGWNKAATTYWRTVLKERPITPNLTYPALPTHLTHGVAETKPTVTENVFSAARKKPPAEPQPSVFQPKSSFGTKPKA